MRLWIAHVRATVAFYRLLRRLKRDGTAGEITVAVR